MTIAPFVVGGCTVDPSMALIPTPQPRATVLPSEAPEQTPDGFANILADPATVAGLPRRPDSIAREEETLRAEGAATVAATSRIRSTGSVAALQERGRNHVAETRAAIEAGARPQDPDAPAPPPLAALPGTAAAAPAAPEPGPAVPLDPDAPPPRQVGGPPPPVQ